MSNIARSILKHSINAWDRFRKWFEDPCPAVTEYEKQVRKYQQENAICILREPIILTKVVPEESNGSNTDQQKTSQCQQNSRLGYGSYWVEPCDFLGGRDSEHLGFIPVVFVLAHAGYEQTAEQQLGNIVVERNEFNSKTEDRQRI